MEKSPEAKEILLISVRNDIQAALVENLLKEQNIYSAKRHMSIGAVAALYTGMSNLGIDIYVNENDVEAAKEIIKVYETMVSEEELEKQALESEMPDAEQSAEKPEFENNLNAQPGTSVKYRIAAVLFLLIMFIMLLKVLR